jgi:hypothetical protein
MTLSDEETFLAALHDLRARLLLGGGLDARQLDPQRAHARGADHRRDACGRVLEIAADAARGLAVEDVLRRHGAEHVHEVAHRLALPLAETLLLLERLMVAERAAAHLDREPARLEVGPVRAPRVRPRVGAGLIWRPGFNLVAAFRTAATWLKPGRGVTTTL